MSATTGTTGLGTLLKIGNGASSETFAAIAEVKSISGPPLSREMAEATHMESPNGYREYLPSFKDAGEVSVEVNFLPANSGQKALVTDMNAGTKRNFQLVWPNTGATKWSFSAYVTGFQPNATIGDVLSASVKFRVTGGVTIS